MCFLPPLPSTFIKFLSDWQWFIKWPSKCRAHSQSGHPFSNCLYKTKYNWFIDWCHKNIEEKKCLLLWRNNIHHFFNIRCLSCLKGRFVFFLTSMSCWYLSYSFYIFTDVTNTAASNGMHKNLTMLWNWRQTFCDIPLIYVSSNLLSYFFKSLGSFDCKMLIIFCNTKKWKTSHAE